MVHFFCVQWIWEGKRNGREWWVHLIADSDQKQIPFHSLLSIPPSSGWNISFTSINDMKFHFSFLKDINKRKRCNCHVNISFLFIPSLMDSHCEDVGVWAVWAESLPYCLEGRSIDAKQTWTLSIIVEAVSPKVYCSQVIQSINPLNRGSLSGTHWKENTTILIHW